MDSVSTASRTLFWLGLIHCCIATATSQPCDPNATHGGTPSGTTQRPAVYPTVTLRNGILHGTTSLLPSATAVVNQYLGIPFAASPPRRFEPPTEVKSWKSPRQVQNYTAACVQQFDYPEIRRQITMQVFNAPGQSAPAESEDCLYLNVYTPSTPSPKTGRTVLFWLFGGAFQFGTAMQNGYDGSSFAYSQDVVVVVPNYRTNVFGFSSAPQLGIKHRNAGLLDQRMARDWVQDNIKRFGGDPNKVTIFGESAGAASVDRLVTTFGSDAERPPPFRAAIMESGQATYGSLAADVTAAGLRSWEALVKALNCSGSASSQEAYRCAQSAPASTIKNIVEQNSLSFAPIPDNYTQLADPIAAYAQGQTARAPILQGTNANEGTIFTLGQSNLANFLNTTFTNVTERQSIAAAFPASAYGGSEGAAIADIVTKLAFACPQSALVDAMQSSGHYAGRQWQYLFNATFPNTQPLLSTYGFDLQAFHSSEIGLVWGTYPRANATAQEFVLSQYMQGAWADFAKDPTRGPGWNAVGTLDGVDLAVLGANGSSGATMRPRSAVDDRCDLFAKLIRPGAQVVVGF